MKANPGRRCTIEASKRVKRARHLLRNTARFGYNEPTGKINETCNDCNLHAHLLAFILNLPGERIVSSSENVEKRRNEIFQTKTEFKIHGQED